jgi:hypothetical protein
MIVKPGAYIKITTGARGTRVGTAQLIIERGKDGSVITKWRNSRGEVTVITHREAQRKIADGYVHPAGSADADATLTFE